MQKNKDFSNSGAASVDCCSYKQTQEDEKREHEEEEEEVLHLLWTRSFGLKLADCQKINEFLEDY